VAQGWQKIFNERLHGLAKQTNYRVRWICPAGGFALFSFFINNRIAA
jgi:hypothetical protein